MINDETKDTFVIVKHIPKQLSVDDCKELFSLFNLKSFKFLSNNGPNGNNAFLIFKCPEDAHIAVFNLHERKIFDHYLCAKILRHHSAINNGFEDSEMTKDKKINSKNQTSSQVIPDWVTELLSLAPKLNFTDPIKPKLRYKYPKPNNIILTNIVRALMSNEHFYTQTLHLMNKFHFPVPFTCDITFPGRIIVINSDDIIPFNHTSSNIEKNELTEMEISSGNESEISDDYHSPKIKRRKISLPKIRNIPPTVNYPFHSQPMKTYAIEELFDTAKNRSDNQIKLNVTSTINSVNKNIEQIPPVFIEEDGFGKICDVLETSNTGIVEESVIENINENFLLKKETTKPVFNNADKSKTVLISKPVSTLSMDEIRNNTMSSTLWTTVSAFKNYNRGIPSCRLYVKNLAKKVVKDDLINLYSGFIDWSDNEEINMFSVTCFTEGRMKGQAFINFPSTSSSERALELTNAFVLYDRPLVVQFAKTAS